MALLAQVSTQKLITTVIQASSDVNIKDQYNTPGYLTTGFLTLATSSTTESYTFTNNPLVTGTVSTVGLSYYNDPDFQTGSLYVSSLYLGGIGGTVKGQLTTDDTASDIYWNGTSLTTGGGGGGITTEQLTSTTIGLGTLDYVSSASLASSLTSTIEIVAFAIQDTITNLGTYGYVSSLGLVSTVDGLGSSGYISTGGQGYFSSVTINMLPQDAPPWDPKTFPALGFDPEPEPLALDVFGSARILKNLYIGSTTTVIGTAGIAAPLISSASLFASSLTFYDPTTLTTMPLSLSNSSLLVNGSNIVTTSNGAVLNFLSTPNLISTVGGLGSAGYISSASLLSTTNGINLSLSSLSTSYGAVLQTSSLSAITITAGQGIFGVLSAQTLFVSSIQSAVYYYPQFFQF